ncbi:hypothetical protein ACQKM9_04255 [Viridibacillus sp. NPDC093762]|uniref:hypothetical protein n=1 Tax=Viridibacillus sp. NPDC093762 TaxID=3390720 RepID=UPI003D01E3E8
MESIWALNNKYKGSVTILGIPANGWVALSIWIAVIVLPWTYSLYFIKRINDSGVERWGAKPKKVENTIEDAVRV